VQSHDHQVPVHGYRDEPAKRSSNSSSAFQHSASPTGLPLPRRSLRPQARVRTRTRRSTGSWRSTMSPTTHGALVTTWKRRSIAASARVDVCHRHVKACRCRSRVRRQPGQPLHCSSALCSPQATSRRSIVHSRRSRRTPREATRPGRLRSDCRSGVSIERLAGGVAARRDLDDSGQSRWASVPGSECGLVDLIRHRQLTASRALQPGSDRRQR